MKQKQKLTQEIRGELSLTPEPTLDLALKVRSDIRDYWNAKIMDRIVPTEVKRLGPVDMEAHESALRKLAVEQAGLIEMLFAGPWKAKEADPIFELHYFGVGTGEALKLIAKIANRNKHTVVAWDTSDVGYANAAVIFDKLRSPLPNMIYLADIEDACNLQFLRPERARKLVIARVLDVLDKEDEGWEKIPYHERKMARTAREIGAMLTYLEVFLLHPSLEDNLGAIWGDTTPHPLEEVVGFMQEGCEVQIEATKLGKIDHYGHIYTAVRIAKVQV